MQPSQAQMLDGVLQQVFKIQQQQNEDRLVLTSLEKNVFLIQNQLSTSTSSRKFPTAKKNTISHQLARDVSSVVGLKEAITWESKVLRCIWAMALCAGVVATAYFVYSASDEYFRNPTATKVEMVAKTMYDYPPVILCPSVWLNINKALSLGLSVEGLKYSLGYVNGFGEKIKPNNKTVGRREFFSFYEKRNFTSFDDYLMDISHDVDLERSVEKYENSFNSSCYCSRCQVLKLPKVVTKSGVCYNFQLLPENGRQLSSLTRYFGMQLWDDEGKSRQLSRTTSLWLLYVGAKQHLNMKNPIVPQLFIKEFTFVKVRFHELQVNKRHRSESPCKSDVEAGNNYSATVCITKCLTPLYSRALNCTPFEKTVGKFENHPSEMCNTFDKTTWFEFQESTKTEKDSVIDSDEAKMCYRKCPYKCHRTRYETTYEGEFNNDEHIISWSKTSKTARLHNTTFVDVGIENAALYLGGVVTFLEINTISFASLISNIGGTLGLFVGATMMTFVQIVLFIIKIVAEKKKMAAKNEVGNTKESSVVTEISMV